MSVVNYMAIPGIPRTTNRDRSRLIRVFDPAVVIKTSCEYFGITLEGLNIRCKKRELVMQRQIIMYFLSEYTDWTYKNIGGLFGRDHTTAIYSRKTIKDLMYSDDNIRYRIDELKKQIANNH